MIIYYFLGLIIMLINSKYFSVMQVATFPESTWNMKKGKNSAQLKEMLEYKKTKHYVIM